MVRSVQKFSTNLSKEFDFIMFEIYVKLLYLGLHVLIIFQPMHCMLTEKSTEFSRINCQRIVQKIAAFLQF